MGDSAIWAEFLSIEEELHLTQVLSEWGRGGFAQYNRCVEEAKRRAKEAAE